MYKKALYLALAATLLGACDSVKSPRRATPMVKINPAETLVTVKNTLSTSRNDAMVALPLPAGFSKGNVIVLDAQGQEVPSQITYDNQIIFLTDIGVNAEQQFRLKTGKPTKVENTAQGRQYPERLDDMAWENDVMGYRAYGPALQQTGETSFGYDLFAKHPSDKPMLDTIYAKELDHETRRRSKALKETDPEESLRLWQSISYHYDRGQGLDVYSVGPTLGAGVTALMKGDTILYPYCYKDYEILDNGPLRFTVKLTFNPVRLPNGEQVVEQRLIQLDKGSHLNRTEISYKGLKNSHSIGSGIVLHDISPRIYTSPDKRIMSYVDPTNTADKSNGEIFVGMIFPQPVKDFKVLPFAKEKQKKIKAFGHLIAQHLYQPNETFLYYWGAGWSKGDILSQSAWNSYLQNFKQSIDNPLKINIK